MARLRFVQNVSLWHIKNGISSSNISRYFRISLQLNFGTPSKSEHVLAAGPNIKLTGHWQLNSLKGKRKTNFQEDKTSLQLGKSFKYLQVGISSKNTLQGYPEHRTLKLSWKSPQADQKLVFARGRPDTLLVLRRWPACSLGSWRHICIVTLCSHTM